MRVDDAASLDELLREAANDGRRVIRLNGADVCSREAFFSEVKTALPPGSASGK